MAYTTYTEINDAGKYVPRYPLGRVAVTITQADIETLVAFKTKTGQRLDELNAAKKVMEKERDFATARFYRDEISDQLKYQRAVRLLLGVWANDPLLKDCPTVPIKDWSEELFAHLDHVWGLVY